MFLENENLLKKEMDKRCHEIEKLKKNPDKFEKAQQKKRKMEATKKVNFKL